MCPKIYRSPKATPNIPRNIDRYAKPPRGASHIACRCLYLSRVSSFENPWASISLK